MAARCGSVNPGPLLLWLLEREAIDASEMALADEEESECQGWWIAGIWRRLLPGPRGAGDARDRGLPSTGGAAGLRQ
jgi:hypothetical protein